tara:strand:- start:394 stop:648 length:255 start_codon:yes stop_codon:yes gene_type:complete
MSKKNIYNQFSNALNTSINICKSKKGLDLNPKNFEKYEIEINNILKYVKKSKLINDYKIISNSDDYGNITNMKFIKINKDIIIN